jgi:nitrite reductase/ring-hydroxylating ferredoxin subunit
MPGDHRNHAGEGHNRAARSSARFVSPFALNATGNWLEAGALTEIPEGGVKAMEIGGEKVILSRRGAAVTCFQNACAHLGFPIHDGEVENGIIACPHHGFRYDLSSGECLVAPEVRLQSHAVRVTGSRRSEARDLAMRVSLARSCEVQLAPRQVGEWNR